MCDTLVALPVSTARGGLLFAKNSDRERNEAQLLEISPARHSPPSPLKLTYITIPDVAETYTCLLIPTALKLHRSWPIVVIRGIGCGLARR